MNWDIYTKKYNFIKKVRFSCHNCIPNYCAIFYVCPKIRNNCTIFAKFVSHFLAGLGYCQASQEFLSHINVTHTFKYSCMLYGNVFYYLGPG